MQGDSLTPPPPFHNHHSITPYHHLPITSFHHFLCPLITPFHCRYAASGVTEGVVDGGVLVDYVEVPKMRLNDRVALWLAADVFLLTCIREGLNLMPLEYIYARQHLESAGVVVASEFSCVSTLLSGALKVGCYLSIVK